VDGDRGGELVLRELLQTSEVDFIARAQKGKEVEELTNKQIMKSLRNKVHAEQFVAMYSLENGGSKSEIPKKEAPEPPKEKKEEPKKKDAKKSSGRKLLGRKDSDETPPDAPKSTLSDEQKMYKDMYDEISGKALARIISEANSVIAEMPVKDLAEALKGQGDTQGVKAIVFDGIVTQRLLDIAHEMGIGTLTASKVGSVSKYPDGMNVLTKDDFS
jgi:DNA primase